MAWSWGFSSAEEVMQLESSTWSPTNVVIVDDDPAVLGALAFSLELEGFRVTTYRSGPELLAEPTVAQSGCLVIDFKMPEMDGLELLTALRQRGVRLPAILITSHPTEAVRRRAEAAGAPIIEKPLLGEALSNAIHAVSTMSVAEPVPSFS
jgi:two-component system, LuxR family, response regulator FixJ